MNNLQPFSNESLSLEKESDRLISKMKTIQKNHTKKKSKPANNYKNVDVLENVHDEKPKNMLAQITEFMDGIKTMENNLNQLNNQLSEGFDDEEDEGFDDEGEEGFDDEEDEGFDDEGEEGFDEEGEEGFENYKLSNGDEIYTKEYESENGGFQKHTSDHYFKLAMRGKINKKMVKQLCKSGIFTKKQCKSIAKKANNKKNSKNNKKSGGKSKGKCNSNRFKHFIDTAVKYVTEFCSHYKKYLQQLAAEIYKHIEGNHSKTDVDIIAQQIGYFLAVPFAILYAYNWYYVMFFRDENKQHVPNNFGNEVNEFVNNGVLKYILTALVQPVILLNAFLRSVCPAILDKIIDVLGYLKFGKYLDFTILQTIVMNPIAQFMALVLIILYLSCKYSTKMFDSLISFMGHGKPPSYIKWLYLIVAYDIIIGVARRANTVVGNMMSMGDKFVGLIKTLMSPFTAFAMWLLLVIFSFLNIRVAGLFAILYLYITSYFAMGLYDDSWKAMNTMFRKSATNIGGKQCPPNPTFLEKLFVVLMEMCYECMFHILYVIVLIYGIYIYLTKLQSDSAKIILSSVNSTIIFLIIVFIITRLKTKMTNPLNVHDYDHL